MYKILWIEDEANGLLAEYANPVLASGYDLEVALDVTDALQRMRDSQYDVIIFDLVINAGSSPAWRAYDDEGNGERYLGLELMAAILTPTEHEMGEPLADYWITPNRVGVLSIIRDADVITRIRNLGVRAIRHKHASGITALNDLVNEVLRLSE